MVSTTNKKGLFQKWIMILLILIFLVKKYCWNQIISAVGKNISHMIFLDKVLVRKKTFLKVLLIAIFVEIAFGLGFFLFYHVLYPTIILPFYLILYFYVVKRRRSFVNFPLMSLEGLLFICITLNVPMKFSGVLVYLFLLISKLWFLF